MTSSTDKIQAVTDGTSTDRRAKQPEPGSPYGCARQRESRGTPDRAWSESALYETEQLTRRRFTTGLRPVIDHQGTSDRPAEISHLLRGADQCLEAADHYLRMLDSVIDDRRAPSEEPIPLR